MKYAVAMGLVGMAVAVVYVLRAWPMINVVETGRTPEYPDVIPRTYAMPRERVYDAALHAVDRLPRWSLVTNSPESGEIAAEARTRVLRFVDDVRVRIESADTGTIVKARSASRVGRGDFGQNARNIRAFFEELDRQMAIGAGAH
jgi:uncharacterized protein (DUF1499 family)